MKYIDISTWKRALHCDVFRNSVQPQYCVTFDVDITMDLCQYFGQKKSKDYAAFLSSSSSFC